MISPKPSTPEPVCHIVTPVGMFGFGFDEQELQTALAGFSTSPAPTAIILDSGSTDSGPRKLAQGDMSKPRASYVRDFRKLLRCARRFRVPILISSAGGAGTNAHVHAIEDVIREVVAESGPQTLKVISILAEVDKSLVHTRLRSQDIVSCGISVPALTDADVDDATLIVAQMGAEPYVAALQAHGDVEGKEVFVILGGRSNDPAPYVAFATACFRKKSLGNCGGAADGGILSASVAGGIQHMGKIMECGGLCAEPKSAGAAATVFADGSFEIVPTHPRSRCTAVSVAAHTLYENGRPDVIAGPGGWLGLDESRYEQMEDGRTVRVRGGVYKRSVENGRPYQVKLEGARNRGYRYMYMGAMRDPILISQLERLLLRVKEYVQLQVDGLKDGMWDLEFHVHGRGTSEIFLVGEVLAQTSDLALSIVSTARTATIHGSYPGQKATGGNFAFGVGGIPYIDCGVCPEFCVYHLMNLVPGEELSLFPISVQHFSGPSGIDGSNDTLPAESSMKDSSKAETKTPLLHQKSASQTLLKEAVVLSDIAKVLRSKNAGPFEITLDVMFDRPEVFATAKNSGLLTADSIAQLYGLTADEIIWSGWYEQALAFKATIPRKRNGLAVSNGGFMENDMHGAQMYMPLFQLKLPETLREHLVILDD